MNFSVLDLITLKHTRLMRNFLLDKAVDDVCEVSEVLTCRDIVRKVVGVL